MITIFVVLLIGSGMLLLGCGGLEKPRRHSGHPREDLFQQLVQEMPLLDLIKAPLHPDSTRTYFQYYGIHFEGSEHFFGRFSSQGYRLAAHVFKPSAPKGTVFILHGYNDHTGLFTRLIRNCLEQGLVVAIYDLPGHGLSSGERASIRDFAEYVTIFNDFIVICQPYLPAPYYLIGHSTGCAIAYDYLSASSRHTFEQIVFLAPLVRSAHWHLSKVAYYVAKPLIKFVSRRTPTYSADPVFVEFVAQDVLQSERVPLKWVGALYSWNERIQDREMLATPLLVIQGKHDAVVDWKYNIPFLQKKCQTITIRWLEHGGHQLVNAIEPLQTEIFQYINEYLTLVNRLNT